MLSFIYRLLTRFQKRDEVTSDMIGTFEEARVEARDRGRWSYFLFGVSEISGLFGSPGRMIPRARWMLVAGGGLAGLAIGVAASYFWPMAYTSETTLFIEGPIVPKNLIASEDVLELEPLVQGAKYRLAGAAAADTPNLFPSLWAGGKAGAIREELNKALRVERSGDSIRVAFTYRDYPSSADDAKKAARLTNEFASLLIEGRLRQDERRIMGTVQFFETLANNAVGSWEKLNNQMRGLTDGDPRFDRLALDRELARKEYETMRQKLSEAQGLRDLAIRQKGLKLQILSPAQPPEGPDISRRQVVLAGLGSGLLLGLIAWLWVTMRSVPSASLTPEPAAGD